MNYLWVLNLFLKLFFYVKILSVRFLLTHPVYESFKKRSVSFLHSIIISASELPRGQPVPRQWRGQLAPRTVRPASEPIYKCGNLQIGCRQEKRQRMPPIMIAIVARPPGRFPSQYTHTHTLPPTLPRNHVVPYGLEPIFLFSPIAWYGANIPCLIGC